MSESQMTRRGMLVAVGAVGLSACSARPQEQSENFPPATTRPRPTSTSDPRSSLAAAKAYVPLPGEVRPGCKKAAADAVARALTWNNSDGHNVARRLPGVPNRARVAEMLRPLVTDDVACVTSVTYPQYGGLNTTLTSASVMLVGRQTLLARGEGRPWSRDFIVDVRLLARRTTWQISSVAVGTPPPTGEPDPESRALLANPRVEIPQPARADLHAGVIIPEVAALLNDLSRRWSLDVQVLRTGHPRNVFATDRLSNHTRGRAVDIWAINGTPVINAGRALWEPVLTAAARLGANEVGGPALPERSPGLPPVFFTNPTHQDHLHLGFELDTS